MKDKSIKRIVMIGKRIVHLPIVTTSMVIIWKVNGKDKIKLH